MKQVKLVALVVTAALAAVAVIGAGTASATTLCKANESTCAAGNQYPAGTTLKGTGTSEIVFEGMSPSICQSTMEVSFASTSKPKESLTGELTSFKFSSCVGSCRTITARNLPASTNLAATSGGNGTLSVPSGSSASLELVGCYVLPNYVCTYSLAGASLSFTGGSPASLSGTPKLKRTSGALCPESFVVNVKDSITSPSGVWLAN